MSLTTSPTTHETDEEILADVMDGLDLTIDETVFVSPGEDDGVAPIEAWSTFGTTCWSCNSCGCSGNCGVSCNC